MKKFKLMTRRPDGGPAYETDAYPLMVTVGTTTVKLGVHRVKAPASFKGTWVVSDPVSGARVLQVPAWYKGMPVINTMLAPRDAQRNAHEAIEAKLQEKGADAFLAAMARCKAVVDRWEDVKAIVAGAGART